MYESFGLQFSRATARIQLAPDTFGKSWLVMTFITNKEDAFFSVKAYN